MVDALQGAFPNTPIYPALGNHDNFPSDELPQPPYADAWLGTNCSVHVFDRSKCARVYVVLLVC